MKKFPIFFVLVLIVTLTITACSTIKLKDDPEIIVQFNVTDLTDKEFSSVGTKGLDNPTKDDFKNIEFTLDFKQSSNKTTNRKIVIPDIKKMVNSYDMERYWFGQSYNQDNSQEDFAKYGYKFVLYSKGLSQQDIKNIYKASDVLVSWTTKDGTNEERIFKLNDIIQFK